MPGYAGCRSSAWSVLTPYGVGRALAPPALDGDFGEDRHRDLFRRDRAEIESGRRLDAVDRGRLRSAGHELFAQRRHLAAAADEGVILGLDGERRAQGGLIALALGRNDDETPGFVEVAGREAVDDDMGVGLGGDIGG